MKFTETDLMRPLHEAAKKGDLNASKELIKACRRTMLIPYWEDASEITEEIAEHHIKRREKAFAKRVVVK